MPLSGAQAARAHAEELDDEVDAPDEPYPVPAGLEMAAEAWHATIEALEEQDTFQVSDLPLIARYVQAILTASRARSATGGKLFAVGSMGQEIIHPGIKLARDCDQDADRYATRLLLTPEARVRAKVGVRDDDPDLGDLLADPPDEAPA